MKTHSRTVVSIDWDYFTGDTRGYADPCCLCQWRCAPAAPDRRHKRSRNNRAADERAERGKLQGQEKFYRLTPKHALEFNFAACLELTVDPMAKKLKGAQVIVADCHGSIYRYLNAHDIVINFDAHEDRGGTLAYPNCANWASKAADNKGAHYIWNYSSWDPKFPARRVGLVFMCLSSPYTPPKMDHHFYEMVRVVSAHAGASPKFVGLGARELEKKYKENSK